MAQSLLRGFWRVKPTLGASVSDIVYHFKASFDPTSSSQISLGFLPNGATPLSVTSLAGATGGTNPTVDIGTSGDDDGFADELDADTLAENAGTGALTGVLLTTDTEVFGKVGASAATGGTTTVLIRYTMA